MFLDYYKNATYFHDAVKLSKHKETLIKKKDSSKHSINKRAVPCPVKYLEVRLLIDKDMVSYHGQDAVSYSLTLMNIVSIRFCTRTVISRSKWTNCSSQRLRAFSMVSSQRIK